MGLVKPAVKRGIRVLRRPDGTLSVGRSMRFVRFAGRGAEVVERALALANGTRQKGQILLTLNANFPEVSANELEQAWDAIEQADLLYEGDTSSAGIYLSDEELQRFNRQLPYWGAFEHAQEGRNRFQMQKDLIDARVLVIGVGGLGSWIAYGLAAAGVGHLRIVDPDHVSLTDLNRQILYDRSDVGMAKVDSATKRLKAFYPEIDIEAFNEAATDEKNIRDKLRGIDFAILAADHPPGMLRRWFTQACAAAKTPHLLIGGTLLGPFVVPGDTACFGCYEEVMRQADPDYDILVDQVSVAPPENVSVPFNHAIVSGMVIRETMMFLSGAGHPTTWNRVLRLNVNEFTSQALPLEKQTTCYLCGARAAVA